MQIPVRWDVFDHKQYLVLLYIRISLTNANAIMFLTHHVIR